MPLPLLRFFFGHHKCATTWICDILKLACRDLGLRFASLHSPAMFDYRLDAFAADNRIDFLAYTNADIQHVRALPPLRGFHVIRDPRDIVVSAYFSHLLSHPTDEWAALSDHRKKLQEVSKNEGLFLEMDFRSRQFELLYNWDYGRPDVLELKMETLVAAPYEQMAKIFSFLGLVGVPTAWTVRALYLLNAARRPVALKDRVVGKFLLLARRYAGPPNPSPQRKQNPVLPTRTMQRKRSDAALDQPSAA